MVSTLHRSSRFLSVLLLLAGLVVAVSSAPRAGAATAPLCSAQRLSGLATMSSRPGGTTVRLTLTNRHHPSCLWSSRTGFQFLSAAGAIIGPTVFSTPSMESAVARPVYLTFQIVVNVTTMEGVLCSAKVASRLRVTTPDRRSLVFLLGHSMGVCVGGTTKWTTVSPAAFPVAARCTSSSLKVAIGPASGAAGTTYLPLRFTNVGGTPCVLAGTPSVQPLAGAPPSGARTAVGPPARRIDLSSHGFGNPVRLAPGETASAPYGVVQSGNYPASSCVAKAIHGIQVGLAGFATRWLPAAFSVCTRIASTTISGIVPGSDGVEPTT